MPKIPSGKDYSGKRETDARRELSLELEDLRDHVDAQGNPLNRERSPAIDNEQAYLERQVFE